MQKSAPRYIFSTDHKVLGLQYGFTSMFFLLVGFALVLIIRPQMRVKQDAIPPHRAAGVVHADAGCV
jgi:heme/copper-type cytochrome/quinol oxidase subunit 1